MRRLYGCVSLGRIVKPQTVLTCLVLMHVRCNCPVADALNALPLSDLGVLLTRMHPLPPLISP
jgi:hypothetical protein